MELWKPSIELKLHFTSGYWLIDQMDSLYWINSDVSTFEARLNINVGGSDELDKNLEEPRLQKQNQWLSTPVDDGFVDKHADKEVHGQKQMVVDLLLTHEHFIGMTREFQFNESYFEPLWKFFGALKPISSLRDHISSNLAKLLNFR